MSRHPGLSPVPSKDASRSLLGAAQSPPTQLIVSNSVVRACKYLYCNRLHGSKLRDLRLSLSNLATYDNSVKSIAVVNNSTKDGIEIDNASCKRRCGRAASWPASAGTRQSCGCRI